MLSCGYHGWTFDASGTCVEIPMGEELGDRATKLMQHACLKTYPAEDRAGSDSLGLHLQRYEFAAKHARPGRLLDLACGVGYGTRLLAVRSALLGGSLSLDRTIAVIPCRSREHADVVDDRR